jgi:hypothetical protein
MPGPPMPCTPGPMSVSKMQGIRASGYQQPGARATGRQVAAGGSQVGQPRPGHPAAAGWQRLRQARRQLLCVPKTYATRRYS